jgi:threonine dehydratase
VTATGVTDPQPFTRDAIAATHERIGPYIRRTPTVTVDPADLAVGGRSLVAKLELLQHSGSFKARGALANLVDRPVPPAGVVAASGGNHGAAVAFAARRLGVAATIFVPSVSSSAKVDRIRSYGADLRVVGRTYADALVAARAWAAETGALAVHAFDSVDTILGQGTLARELDAQSPDLDTVLVAVGGGGLVAGTASWYAGRLRVVGVEPEGAPTLTMALAAGRPVDAPAGSIAADSLAPSQVGALVFPVAVAHVARVVLVTDDDMRAAQHRLWERLRVVAEPGAAAPLAALVSGAYRPDPDERVGVVVSGANTAAVAL